MNTKRNISKIFPLLLGSFVVCAIALSLLVIMMYTRLLKPVSADATKKQFEVKAGQSGQQIAQNLEAAGLVKSALAFRIYAQREGIGNKFGEGFYYLSPAMGAETVALELLKGEKVDVKVTIIEGWRNEEIAKKLSETLGIDEKEFLAEAEEGYMFPDTYLFNKKAAAVDIAAAMRANFDKRITEDLRRKIQSQKLTLKEGITLASIVERESYESVPNERQIIASVLNKRLRQGMPLQTDATVQYALGYDNFQKKWWRLVTREQLQSTKSPYNTYLNQGLPPAPIANPGLEAIEAVANISDTPYLFYIHGKDGIVRFARTLEEHNANVQQYIQN